MECRLSWHLSNGINRNLSALRVSLTVAVEHFEWNLFDVQRLQCPCSVPYRNRRCLVFLPVCLREHEPISAEHEALEHYFRFGIVTSALSSLTVRLHVTGMHSSIAFSPRLTWRPSSFQRLKEAIGPRA